MLPKRHRRSIRLEGRQYFWVFTTGRNFDHRRTPQLVIQSAGGGRLLIVRTPSWPDMTPKLVEQVIREALAGGWLGTQESRPFVLEMPESRISTISAGRAARLLL
jgi:hypothetical protein